MNAPIALALHQRLGGRSKQERPDCEHRVVAAFEATQLAADSRRQLLETEWLDDIVIGSGIEASDDIRLAASAGQHDDRHLVALPTQFRAIVTSITIGQAHIQYH